MIRLRYYPDTQWKLSYEYRAAIGCTHPNYREGLGFGVVAMMPTSPRSHSRTVKRQVGVFETEPDLIATMLGKPFPVDGTSFEYMGSTFRINPIGHSNASGSVLVRPRCNSEDYDKLRGYSSTVHNLFDWGRRGNCKPIRAGQLYVGHTVRDGRDYWSARAACNYGVRSKSSLDIRVSYDKILWYYTAVISRWQVNRACVDIYARAIKYDTYESFTDRNLEGVNSYSVTDRRFIDIDDYASDSELQEAIQEAFRGFVVDGKLDDIVKLAQNSPWETNYNRIYTLRNVTIGQCNAMLDCIEHQVNTQYGNVIHAEWGDTPSASNMAYKALQDVGICDNNGIAYLKDTLEIGQAFTSFANTLKSLPSTKVKAAAALYLAAHYGFKLQFLDTQEYFKFLKGDSVIGRSVRRVSSEHHAYSLINNKLWHRAERFHIYYGIRGSDLGLTNELLHYLDLDLTSENIWDMVPFSFVIDWFSNMGSWLTSLDNYRHVASRYSVLGCCQSIKYSAGFQPEDLGESFSDFSFDGDIDIKMFVRSGLDHCPTPLPSHFFKGTSPLNHVIEGASLIVTAL